MPVYEGLINSETRELYTKISYTGCVLGEFERNGRDDSDFYAVVWDEEKQEVRIFQYNSTRYAGGGNATIDATPEIIEKARAFYRPQVIAAFQKAARIEAQRVRNGDDVVVVSGRKVPVGTTGRAFWMGQPRCFGRGTKLYTRVGIRTNTETLFVSSEKLQVVESVWTSRVKPEDTILREVEDYLNQSWFSITEGLFYAGMTAMSALGR